MEKLRALMCCGKKQKLWNFYTLSLVSSVLIAPLLLMTEKAVAVVSTTDNSNAITKYQPSTSGDIPIGLTLDQFIANLKHREQEVNSALNDVDTDDEKITQPLRDQWSFILAYSDNAQSAWNAYKLKLNKAFQAISQLDNPVKPEQLDLARIQLELGNAKPLHELMRQVVQHDPKQNADIAFQLGSLALDVADFKEAWIYSNQATQVQPDNIEFLTLAGFVARDLGLYPEAETLYLKAVSVTEQTLGKQHSSLSNILQNLAATYLSQSKFAHAEPLFERALAIDQIALGKQHPDTILDLYNLGEIYRIQEKYQQAESMYRQVLEIEKKSLGKNHIETARNLEHLAAVLVLERQYNQAEKLYLQAISIWQKNRGKDHSDTVDARNELIKIYQTQGKIAKANALLKQQPKR